MPLMKSKRTWRMEGMMQFKTPINSLEGWVTELWLHVKHSWEEQAMQENSLSQQGELKVTEISSSWRLFRKGFAFCSVTLWSGAGQLWAFVGHVHKRSSQMSQMIPMECEGRLREGPWGAWNLTAVKALIGPGRFFNIFKYPHESKNTTSGNWNCQMRRLSFFLAVTCMWKRFPVNSLWQNGF